MKMEIKRIRDGIERRLNLVEAAELRRDAYPDLPLSIYQKAMRGFRFRIEDYINYVLEQPVLKEVTDQLVKKTWESQSRAEAIKLGKELERLKTSLAKTASDEDKRKALLPAIVDRANAGARVELEEEKEPYGAALTILEIRRGVYTTEELVKYAELVKSELRRFHAYLLDQLVKIPGKKLPVAGKMGIPGLFKLSEDPTAVFYKGANREGRGWVPTHGKTQSFAILKLAAEKYSRNANRKGGSPEMVNLSFSEIEKCLKDPKRCNRQPKWEAIPSFKRRLDSLRRNILKIASFTSGELKVVENNGNAFLIFSLR